jgi:hypothetical protein
MPVTSPSIPATTPPPYGVAEGVTAVAVNDLVTLGGAPSEYVIAGSGKTATDACIWLLDNGVDPGAICWVRPRDPWMLNRAVVQPDPVLFLGTAADIMAAAAAASTADDVFFQLEDAGVMLRIDRSVPPTMAKVPTLAQWELDRLRTIDRVIRLGHLRHVQPGRLVLAEGEAAIAPDAVVVHCAASGLQYPPLVPIWGREAITLQPIRITFACFGAALAGYVEAMLDDDAVKNRLCPPAPFSNTTADWARQQVLAVGRRPSPHILRSGTGPTGFRSTQDASHANWPAPPPSPLPRSDWPSTWDGAWPGWPSSPGCSKPSEMSELRAGSGLRTAG